MKQSLLQEKYPVYVAEIGKQETRIRNIDLLSTINWIVA
jgi:hypothetical protein